MDISIIVAFAGKSRVIGCSGHLPWGYIKADMQRFKECTFSHFCVVGYKTFTTLPPLEGRHLIVLSRKHQSSTSDIVFASSVDEAINIAKENKEMELFCIGGSQVYKAFLPLANRLYITEVAGEHEGDAFFPAFNLSEYDLVEYKEMERVTFKTYEIKG